MVKFDATIPFRLLAWIGLWINALLGSINFLDDFHTIAYVKSCSLARFPCISNPLGTIFGDTIDIQSCHIQQSLNEVRTSSQCTIIIENFFARGKFRFCHCIVWVDLWPMIRQTLHITVLPFGTKNFHLASATIKKSFVA